MLCTTKLSLEVGEQQFFKISIFWDEDILKERPIKWPALLSKHVCTCAPEATGIKDALKTVIIILRYILYPVCG